MDLQTSNSPLSSPTPEMLSAFLKEIEQEQARRRTENALAYYRPYAKQREFHAAGMPGPLARRRIAARPALERQHGPAFMSGLPQSPRLRCNALMQCSKKHLRATNPINSLGREHPEF
jgi:hypothetical protein